MTIPFERTRAILATKYFLESLLDKQQTPRVPKAIRDQARALLRHYPNSHNIEQVNFAWNNPERTSGFECPFASPDEDFFGKKQP